MAWKDWPPASFRKALRRFCRPAERAAGPSLLVSAHLSWCFCLTLLMHFVENTQRQVGAVFLGEFIACCWTARYMLGDGNEIMAARLKIQSHYKENGQVFFFGGRGPTISEEIKLEDCDVIEKGN